MKEPWLPQRNRKAPAVPVPSQPPPKCLILLPADKESFTTKEAGHILTIHQDTIRRWINTGHLKAFVLPGGEWRIPRQEIIRIGGNTVKVIRQPPTTPDNRP